MRFVLTGAVVEDESLHLPGGMIGRWRASVAREVTRQSKREAPVNERSNKSNRWAKYPVGSLRRQIESSTSPVGLRVWNIDVTAKVPYALFVHEGTKPLIFSRRQSGGRFGGGRGETGGMFLPANPPYGFRNEFKQVVSGQRANPFLRRGLRAAGAKHPSLRG